MVMADSFNFELVSPEQLLMSAMASQVVIPASEGEMTVLPDHAPTMTTIRPGVVTVKMTDGKDERFVVFGGFADILPTGCTLLAESVVPFAEFNKAVLEKRVETTTIALAAAQDEETKTWLAQLLADLSHLFHVAN